MKRDLLLKKQQQERKLLLQQQQQQILHLRLKPESEESLLSNGVCTYVYYLNSSEMYILGLFLLTEKDNVNFILYVQKIFGSSFWDLF